jgi:hypothetical protein
MASGETLISYGPGIATATPASSTLMPTPSRLVRIVLEVEDELTHDRVSGVEVENPLLRLEISVSGPDLDHRIIPNSFL